MGYARLEECLDLVRVAMVSRGWWRGRGCRAFEASSTMGLPQTRREYPETSGLVEQAKLMKLRKDHQNCYQPSLDVSMTYEMEDPSDAGNRKPRPMPVVMAIKGTKRTIKNKVPLQIRKD